MEIPDDWEVVDHPDEIQALKVGKDRYMYLSFLPMFTKEFTQESTWTSVCSDKVSNEIIEMVVEEDVKMKLVIN